MKQLLVIICAMIEIGYSIYMIGICGYGLANAHYRYVKFMFEKLEKIYKQSTIAGGLPA